MILVAARAFAAPVLETVPDDPLARCAATATAELDHPLAAPPGEGRHDRVAVVAGVPCHESPSIPSLAYSSRDAVRVGDRLRAGGFAVIELLTVVGKADLDGALDRAEALLAPGGTLVVYFSGHGVLREEDGRVRRYLVMSDTDLADLPTTAVPVPALEQRVARVDAASRVVVQDTCFAARPGGKSVGIPAIGHEKGIALPEPGARLEVGDARLYASRFFEQAIESPVRRESVYTWHLLDAFDRPGEADLDGDGCVGLIEAHEWSTRRTEEERQGFQVPQRRGIDPPNLLLGCTPGPATRGVVEAPAGDAWTIEVSRRGEVVGRGTGALDPGRYHVRVERLEETASDVVTRRVLAGPVRIRPGEWLDLRDEIDRRRPTVAVEAVGALRLSDELPALATGLGAWWALRDRGHGRPVLGLAGRAGSDVQFHLLELGGRGAWWFGVPRAALDLGPYAGAGATWRAARDPDTGKIVEGAIPVGSSLEVGLRAQVLAFGRVTIAAESGITGVVLGDPPRTRTRLDTAPHLGVAFGARL